MILLLFIFIWIGSCIPQTTATDSTSSDTEWYPNGVRFLFAIISDYDGWGGYDLFSDFYIHVGISFGIRRPCVEMIRDTDAFIYANPHGIVTKHLICGLVEYPF